MSFMAGFGQSFSRSWEQSAQAENQRKRDAVQMAWNDFTKRRDRMEGWQRDDAKNIQLAKALVEQAGAPESAWTTAYEWISAGAPPAQVMQSLQTGRFEEMEAGPNAIIERPSPVDTQMGQAGLEQAQQPQQAQTNPWQNLRSQLLGPGAPTEPERHRSGAMQEISRATGRPTQEVEEVMNWREPTGPSLPEGAPRMRFTPAPKSEDIVSDPRKLAIQVDRTRKALEENPTPANRARYEQAKSEYDAVLSYENISATQKAEAEARAAGTNVRSRWGVAGDGEGGLRIVNPIVVDGIAYDRREYLNDPENAKPIENYMEASEEEKEAFTKLAGNTRDEVTDFNTRSQNVRNSMRDVADIFDIVDANPEAVLNLTPSVAQTAQRIIEEVTGGLNLLGMNGEEAREVMTRSPEVINKAEQEIEERYNELMSSGKVYNTADAAALLDAKLNILTFRYAAVQGQEGRALSNLKYEIFRDALGSGVTPERFKQVISDFMMREVTDLSDEARAFSDNPHIQELRALDWTYEEIPIKKADPIQQIRDSGDEKLINLLDNMGVRYDSMYGRIGSSAQPEQSAQPNQQNMQAIGRTPDGRTVYQDADGNQWVQ